MATTLGRERLTLRETLKRREDEVSEPSREMLKTPEVEVRAPPKDNLRHQNGQQQARGQNARRRSGTITNDFSKLGLKRTSSTSARPNYNEEETGSFLKLLYRTSSTDGRPNYNEEETGSFLKFGLNRTSSSCGRPNYNEEETGSTGSSSSSSRPSRDFDDTENVLQNLLPGIPDRVTIEGILPKTSWRTLCSLADVNRAWREAIQSRRVYRARNYVNSTNTLAVIIHKSPAPQTTAENGVNRTSGERSVPPHWRYTISVYDPLQDSWHCLPPIPGVSCGIPKSCGCLFLDGKLYVIGGEDYKKVQSTKEVYTINLAACKGLWQKCASMRNGRSEFPCEVNNGRIYVMGGGCQPEMNYSRDAEVFNPRRNEWHPIADMMCQRTGHTVVNLEGKLYVIGGSIWLDEEDDLLYQRLDCDDMFDSTLHARFAEVYDPWKKSWRKVENVIRRETDEAFVVARGILHVLRPDSVHVYDMASNSWTFLQHISWENCIGAMDYCVCTAAFLDGELLALVGRTREEDYGLNLVRSKNFSRRNFQLIWETICCPQELDSQFFGLVPIQL